MSLTFPSYRYNVQEDGTWENRKTFAYVSPGIPDGKCISEYDSCGTVSDFDCLQEFTATQRAMCTPAVGMAFMCGIRPES